ncbi:MAG: tetratricopeptide repeat protein [Burkholderiales bacterium]|nr:tetratricopeptide repeat protein [Burkholderiales bacterium]MDE1925963.1 tetratricopeptide repeat protein [Burkholderiales bacterium]MDE2158134.1 tetratricopeptide repeat protein [Burkholderiales bacterium]MDE2505237.1 tetratricopeptide repeat protein [Burkholderiales bacterium]
MSEPGRDDAPALNERANAWLAQGRPEAAIADYERALALLPRHPVLLANLAAALGRAGRPEAALQACEEALRAAPDHDAARLNRGIALLDLGRLDEARQAFAELVAARPDHAEAHWRLAWCLLLAGDFEPGWREFEWRWRRALPPGRLRAEPRWTGAEALDGRRLLLHAEQGLGDTLQFCRYAALAAARGAEVVLQVQPPLLPLLQDLAGAAEVIGLDREPERPVDLQCPLLSLPLAFGTGLATIPAPRAYLAADAARVAAWAARLGPKRAPRVGLVWSGSAANTGDATRSIALATLLAALPSGIECHSLQMDAREGDLETLRGHSELACYGAELRDFGATAALMMQMDAIVAVDTALAHLAAALGRPTQLLLAALPDWRWMLGRGDSPWYPTLRLQRQLSAGRWEEPLAALRRTLATL